MSSHHQASRHSPFVWTTILLAVALFCSALVHVLSPRTPAIEPDRVDKLARDVERLEHRLEQFENEVPRLLERAERVAGERFDKEVPALLEAARESHQGSRTVIVPIIHEEPPKLFPDDQMYRRFDIRERPHMRSPGDQIVRPSESREIEK